jgi:two-component system CheB/CheR fusion protein
MAKSEATDLTALDGTAPCRLPQRQGIQFDERRCEALMRILTSIVWVTDEEGRFTTAQSLWSDYTGQSWTEQKDFGWLNAVHPADRQNVCATMVEARKRKEVYFATGRLWHAGTQSYRHFEVRGAPILSHDGAIEEWVGTCKDVEDSRRAEEVLREADRRKDEFIAMLAHELRNPLAPIRNAAHVLKRRGNDDMQLSWARGIIERQVAQMAHLLEDLLDVSRISQNKIQLNRSRVTLDSILDTAIEGSRPQFEQYGHTFELNMLSAPIYVDADPARLTQVFSNLLNNAAKYTERGGKIGLTVRLDDGIAEVEVRDNGIGIAADILPRVFDLFCQSKSALNRAQGGLGIGLSIVRSLVEMHGGTVEARSPGLGSGSSFVVRIPTAASRQPTLRSAPPRSAPRSALTVLVADDNRDAAETLSVVLESEGHRVCVASDGEEALSVARAHPPQVALLDIGMPKLTGHQVAVRLRAEYPGIVLVAVTGWGQRDDMRRTAASGFDHHLVKPVDPEHLSAILAAAASAAAAGADANAAITAASARTSTRADH